MCEDKWQDRRWPAGTAVEVVDVNQKRLGVGVLLNEYIPAKECNSDKSSLEEIVEESLEEDWMPRIEMPDGKIIYGYECWWIPVVITKEAEFN
jgi:hypothetical protein